MPRTRAEAARAAATKLLIELPDDLFQHVARFLLAKHLPTALLLRQASKGLRDKLEPSREAASKRRLNWIHEYSDPAATISSDRMRATLLDYSGTVFVVGTLLPSTGTSSWKVRMDNSFAGEAKISFGVCDPSGCCSWGFSPGEGMLVRWTRSLDEDTAALPHGYPDADGTRLTAVGLKARTSVVEVLVDHDQGTLGFRLNDGPLLEAVKADASRTFRGLALRIFVAPGYPPDQVTLLSKYC